MLGIGVPLQSSISSCESFIPTNRPFTGKVLVIGAGAGGLSTAYLLKQQGTQVEVLEASPQWGGRIRINPDFADFPIPLGAEWIETNAGVFKEIVNDDSVTVDIQTILDSPDRKFVNYSWYNFFEDFIHPSVSDSIRFNTAVTSIDYSGDKVIVSTSNGTFTADKVVVSVPLKILKDGSISFSPVLPVSKANAIKDAVVWYGFKAFVEFSSNFYGDNEFIFPVKPETDGQKLYYNAALGQNTSKNILGLFVVGKPAQEYISRSGNDLRNYILSEMDSVYSNKASSGYIKHTVQNWNEEPFIKGGYLSDFADWRMVKTLGESIDGKVFFAGSEFTDGEDWVSVHTASQSAKTAVKAINM
jgi:monoamine oxidase